MGGKENSLWPCILCKSFYKINTMGKTNEVIKRSCDSFVLVATTTKKKTEPCFLEAYFVKLAFLVYLFSRLVFSASFLCSLHFIGCGASFFSVFYKVNFPNITNKLWNVLGALIFKASCM